MEPLLQYRTTPFGFILVLEPGDELIRSLIGFARRQDIDAAVITGIGAVRETELDFYDPLRGTHERRTFDEPLEVLGIQGNVALVDGEPHPHVHGIFGRADFSTVGGHIFEAVCSLALELTVHTSPVPWERHDVAFCNFKVMRLEASK